MRFRTNPDMEKFKTNMGENLGALKFISCLRSVFRRVWVLKSWRAKDSGTRSDSRQLPSLFISDAEDCAISQIHPTS